VVRARDKLEDLHGILDHGGIAGESSQKLRKALDEFDTYVVVNEALIPNYGERWRNEEAIATGFVESAVNQIVSKRFSKKQQMQWSKRGAHLLLQVRAAVLNGDLRERLAYKPPKQAHQSRIAWMFEPTPPLLKAA